MNKEELLKAIMELPKIETNNPISTMNGINVDDLMSAVDRLNKVPNYNDLLKENQELKKQVENCYCNRTDCIGRIKDSKKYDSLVQVQETQQKEFIKYLEDEIKFYKNRDTYIVADILGSYDLNDINLKLLEGILQKYKSIIGVSDENN